MGQHRLLRYLRHPLLALIGTAVCGLAALPLTRGTLDVAQQLAAADDPVAVSDGALDRIGFDQGVAEREIRSALAVGDLDLAQSFLDLAAARGVAVDPLLAGRVGEARTQAASPAGTAGRFLHGLWTGEPADLASLAGTAFGDLFVFGDIRDLTREGTRYLTGEPADPWILGLAGVGIAITAGTYATLGAGAPTRIGLTLAKAARRAGRLNPVLAVRAAREAVKVEEAGGLVELVGNVGRVESKAGTQAALDVLQVAEEPRDVSRLARLAAAKGGKTRAIIKLAGRAAIVAAVGAIDLATWLVWAALALFGFVSSCKAAVERMTLRHLERRRRALRFVSDGQNPSSVAASARRRCRILPARAPRRAAPTPRLSQCRSPLDQRAGRIGRAERLLAGDMRQDLEVVPRIFRVLRLLHLHQQQVVHHQIVFAQPAIAGEEILDRRLAHLGGDLERVVGAGGLDGVEIVHHRGIGPGLPIVGIRRILAKKRFDHSRVLSSMSQ